MSNQKLIHEQQQLSEVSHSLSNQLAPNKIKYPLQILTEQILDQIMQLKKDISDLNLYELKRFQNGLAVFKPQLKDFRFLVKQQIIRKQNQQKRKSTNAQKSKSLWTVINQSCFFLFRSQRKKNIQQDKFNQDKFNCANGYQQLQQKQQEQSFLLQSASGFGNSRGNFNLKNHQKTKNKIN